MPDAGAARRSPPAEPTSTARTRRGTAAHRRKALSSGSNRGQNAAVHHAPEGGAMGFIQIIEYQTDRPDEIQALLDEWDQASPNRLPGAKGTYCADRDNPGTYISIVEFPSYEV